MNHNIVGWVHEWEYDVTSGKNNVTYEEWLKWQNIIENNWYDPIIEKPTDIKLDEKLFEVK